MNVGAIMTSLWGSGIMTRVRKTEVMTDEYGMLVKVNRPGQALRAPGV
jgi:hypothetical protein